MCHDFWYIHYTCNRCAFNHQKQLERCNKLEICYQCQSPHDNIERTSRNENDYYAILTTCTTISAIISCTSRWTSCAYRSSCFISSSYLIMVHCTNTFISIPHMGLWWTNWKENKLYMIISSWAFLCKTYNGELHKLWTKQFAHFYFQWHNSTGW